MMSKFEPITISSDSILSLQLSQITVSGVWAIIKNQLFSHANDSVGAIQPFCMIKDIVNLMRITPYSITILILVIISY